MSLKLGYQVDSARGPFSTKREGGRRPGFPRLPRLIIRYLGAWLGRENTLPYHVSIPQAFSIHGQLAGVPEPTSVNQLATCPTLKTWLLVQKSKRRESVS